MSGIQVLNKFGARWLGVAVLCTVAGMIGCGRSRPESQSFESAPPQSVDGATARMTRNDKSKADLPPTAKPGNASAPDATIAADSDATPPFANAIEFDLAASDDAAAPEPVAAPTDFPAASFATRPARAPRATFAPPVAKESAPIGSLIGGGFGFGNKRASSGARADSGARAGSVAGASESAPQPNRVAHNQPSRSAVGRARSSRERTSGPGNMATALPESNIETLNADRKVARSIEPNANAPTAALESDRDSAVEQRATPESEAFTTVPVYYATDRKTDRVPLSAYEVTGNKRLFAILGLGCLLSIAASALLGLRGRHRMSAGASAVACIAGCAAVVCLIQSNAKIEKRGVTYSGDRGQLTRGICEVTIPKVHRRGMVERPSILRLEFREDQRKHIVLTSAVELNEDDFYTRLSDSVTAAPEQDLLLFIHGYNVDFQSAVRRTAQISVDLPFEGVPICYSWPSQGTLLGYSVDATNAAWTTAHLKQFLLDLVEETGAKSVNVIAHSMGNRPMTAAMEQISWQHEYQTESNRPFDRIVLAAPDVDADRFRRDFGPSLSRVANHVTLYASSDDQALIASKQVHGYPRAGESGDHVVVVPGVETVDVSGIDLSLLGHSYYGDSQSMLRDLYEVVRSRLPAPQRPSLITRQRGELVYWQLALGTSESTTR